MRVFPFKRNVNAGLPSLDFLREQGWVRSTYTMFSHDNRTRGDFFFRIVLLVCMLSYFPDICEFLRLTAPQKSRPISKPAVTCVYVSTYGRGDVTAMISERLHTGHR